MALQTAIPVDLADVRLEADLVVPEQAYGLVLFAHGSGSSRRSPRNRTVAGRLHEHRLATVLADLLTPAEQEQDRLTGELRFDIALLGQRMTRLVDWASEAPPVAGLPVGLFGASTGAAAALVAAAARPALVRAVVSRGGRPDLAGASLSHVRAPTLLLVGERDEVVWRLNQDAAARLGADCQLQMVAGAGHLFEEPGALAEVADRAATWFAGHLSSRP